MIKGLFASLSSLHGQTGLDKQNQTNQQNRFQIDYLNRYVNYNSQIQCTEIKVISISDFFLSICRVMTYLCGFRYISINLQWMMLRLDVSYSHKSCVCPQSQERMTKLCLCIPVWRIMLSARLLVILTHLKEIEHLPITFKVKKKQCVVSKQPHIKSLKLAKAWFRWSDIRS